MDIFTPPPPYSETFEPPQLRDGAKLSQFGRRPKTSTSTTACSESGIDTLPKYAQYIPVNGRTYGSSVMGAAPTIASQSQLTPTKIADSETLLIAGTSTAIERTVSAPAAPLYFRASDERPEFRGETLSVPSSTPSTSTSAYVSTAFREARHFAGGLIALPSESTKHFSILQHSHGLVFYQGCSTSIAISIFSDAPLPAGRQVWLQDKGFSGNTGMRLKALVGSNGSWINVTPAMSISADRLKESDERAWQRDIKKFLKNTKHPKHVLRETLVVRIPVEASDGYFHLVLCPSEKKKVLCPSPVFRILSASTSPYSIRGASLSTLPLELGAMAVTAYANKTIGKIISPATAAASKVAKPFIPSTAKKEAAIALYGKSGAEEMVKSTITNGNVQYKGVRSFSYNPAGIGDSESGPSSPYPICFVARSVIERGDEDYFSMPTMRLSGIAEHTSYQLRGHYFAWVRPLPGRGPRNSDAEVWSQTVISSLPMQASQLSHATISHASQRIFKIHIISDEFEARCYDGQNLEIKVMGFIRPDAFEAPEHSREEELVASLNDIIFAQSILDQPLFAPEIVGDVLARGVLERATTAYADVRLAAQRQVDRVPLHKMGLRMEVDRMRDKGVGMNGFYVVR